MGSHVTPDKLDKEYAYAVRYLYGNEGNGHGFRPYSCVRMIMSEPPNERDGKIHGCPFKTMNEDQLNAMLRRMGLKGEALRECVCLGPGQPTQPSSHPSHQLWCSRATLSSPPPTAPLPQTVRVETLPPGTT
jgi:DNA primase large subunit